LNRKVADAAVQPPGISSDRPDAFISYSRRDKDYVESRLASALEARGKEVWIDTDDIRGGASDWRATVWAGIEASKAVIFVLTPDSLVSRVCADELAHAEALNKRLIPVLHRPVDGLNVPAALERPNWILARDSDDFGTAVTTLVDALETDEQWLDAHARLTQRTAEWLRMDRDRSYLLRGGDLRAAERWLEERGTHKEPPTPEQVAYIAAGRRASARRQAIVLSGVVVALGVSVVLGTLAYIQRQTARSQAYAARAINAVQDDPEQALKLALKAASLRHSALVTRALRESVAASTWSHILRGDEPRPINDVAFSPSGRLAVSGGEDGSANVWDARSGRRLASLMGHTGAINTVAFSPDGRRIVTASADGTARIWDRAGHPLRQLHVGGEVWSAAFDRAGRRVITATDRGSAQVWDLQRSGAPERLPGAGQDRLVFSRFSRDGREALTPGEDGSVRVWTIAPRARVATLRADVGPNPLVTVAAFSPDGRRVLAGYGSGVSCLWTVRPHGRRRPSPSGSCHKQRGSITYVDFRPDGRRFVTASSSGTAVLRAADGRRIATLRQGGQINSVAFSRDGRHIVTAGDDRRAMIWTAGGRLQHVLAGDTDAVAVARFSPSGAFVLTGSADGSARLWAARQGTTELPGPPLTNADVAFSPDGRRLLAVNPDGRAAIWDLVHGAAVPLSGGMGVSPLVTPPCERPTGCAPWSSDAREVAGVDKSYRATIWDARNGRSTRLPFVAAGAAFSLDPRRLVALGGDSGVTLVDPRSGARRGQLRTGSRVESVAFSPNGRMLAVTDQGAVALAHVADGTRAGPSPVRDGAKAAAITAGGGRVVVGMEDGGVAAYDLSGDASRAHAATNSPRDVTDVDFDRAGGQILAVSTDGTVRVWAVQRLQSPPAILRHGADIVDAEFSPDGRFVLTASRDGKATVWDPGLETKLFVIQKSRMGGARFSPDGRVIAVGGVRTVELHGCDACAPFDSLVRLARARLPAG
jgi:WD40 repeat protein